MKRISFLLITLVITHSIQATKIWVSNENKRHAYLVQAAAEGNPNDVRGVLVQPGENPGASKEINMGCVGKIQVSWYLPGTKTFSQPKTLYTGGDLDRFGRKGGRCDGFFYVVIPEKTFEPENPEPMSWALTW